MKNILLTFFLLCFLLSLGTYVFFSAKQYPLSQKEKMYAMKQLLGHDPILSTNPSEGKWIVHRGTYMQFSYPATATIYPALTDNPPSKQSVEIYMFQSEHPKYFFGTEVLDAKGIATYNDIPGVMMRRTAKGVYTESIDTYKEVSFPVFTKMQTQSVEKTAFILRNGREYTYSITSANPDVLSIFDAVLKSVVLN